MDDALLADSNDNTVEKMFEEVMKILPCWGLQITPKKIQRGDSINYLGYKIGLQNNSTPKGTNQERSIVDFNDFQNLLGDITWLQP